MRSVVFPRTRCLRKEAGAGGAARFEQNGLGELEHKVR